MQNQPKQLSAGKAALIGTAVAVPVGLAAFYFGYQTNQTAPPPPPVQTASQTTSQTAPANVADLRIKGNRKSRIYHLKGCGSYDRISDKNVIWFKTTDEAEAAGFRMAQNC